MTEEQIFDQFVTLGFRMMGNTTSAERDSALDVLVPLLDKLDVDVSSVQTFESLEQSFLSRSPVEWMDSDQVCRLYYTALMQYIGLDYSLRKLNALDKLAQVYPALQNYYRVMMEHPKRCSSLREDFEKNLSKLDLTRRHVAGLDAAIAFHEYMIAMSV